MESVHDLIRRLIRIAEMPEAGLRMQFTLKGEPVELAAAYPEDRLGILVTECPESFGVVESQITSKWDPDLGLVREGLWRIAVLGPKVGHLIDAIDWLAKEMGVRIDVSALERVFDREERLSLADESDDHPASLMDQLFKPAHASSEPGETGFQRYEGIQRLLSALNEEQRLAVTASPNAHLLICAGAGTGKTEVIASRVLYLITDYEIPPDAIAVLTFSRGAVQALTERIEFMNVHYGLGLPRLPKVRTLHSFAFEFVRRLAATGNYWLRSGFETVDTTRVIKDDGTVMTIGSVWPQYSSQLFEGLMDNLTKSERLEYYSSAIDLLRCGHSDLGVICRPEELPDDGHIRIVSSLGSLVDLKAADVKAVFHRYYRVLEELQLIDFPAMVSEALYAMRSQEDLLQYAARQLQIIVIDEYQDTSRAQERLVRAIASGGDRHSGPFLNVVGDDDQTIFTFNGSDVTNILEFKQRNAELSESKTTSVTLRINYRSVPGILNASGKLLRKNKYRIPKQLETKREPNPSTIEPVLLLRSDSVESAVKAIAIQMERIRSDLDLAYSDCAVLYRKNSQAFPQADIAIRALGRARIPVNYEVEVTRRWTPLLQRLFQLCRAHRTKHLKVLQDVVDDAIASSFGRKEEEERLRSLRSLLHNYEREGLTKVSQVLEALEAIKNSDPPESDDQGVRVLSVHKAKGQEFACVFVLFLADRQFPDSRAERLGMEEERRVLYVALTRGRDHVCVFGKPSLGEPDFYAELAALDVPEKECTDIIHSQRSATKGTCQQPSVNGLAGSGFLDEVRDHQDNAETGDGLQCEQLLPWTTKDLAGTSDAGSDVCAAAQSDLGERGDIEAVSSEVDVLEDIIELEGSAKLLLEKLKQKRRQIRKAKDA